MDVLSVVLDILGVLAIIVGGALVIVLVTDLIISCFDNHQGVFFNKDKDDEDNTSSVKSKDEVVVYSTKTPDNDQNNITDTTTKKETLDGETVTSVDFDKAIEEQKAMQSNQNNNEQFRKPTPAVAPQQQSRPVPKTEVAVEDENEEDEEFDDILDEVVENTKKALKDDEGKLKKTEAENKELEELRQLTAKQQKEMEELKKMQEQFINDKQNKLDEIKENKDEDNAEDLKALKEDIIKEKEEINKIKQEILDAQKQQNDKPETKETIKEVTIVDDREINRLKTLNLKRMDSRLNSLLKETEKLEDDTLRKRQEALKKLNEPSNKPGKYQLSTKKVQTLVQTTKQKQAPVVTPLTKTTTVEVTKHSSSNGGETTIEYSKPLSITEEVVEVETHKEDTSSAFANSDVVVIEDKKKLKPAFEKPAFEKSYYELRLDKLNEELKEAEKELRINKSEYIPLTRIYKAYERDTDKLRKKEMIVAKQKVALYGVNSNKVDPSKKEKLDENLQLLTELKDSVSHCDLVISKNKDRYPILERNYNILTRQITRLEEDIDSCNKAITWYNRNK